MQNSGLLLNLLEQVLGSSYRLKNNETAFHCPKCSHRKKKLQINLLTGRAHCWVCNFSAHTIPQLLKKINAPQSLIREALKLLGEHRTYERDKKELTEWNVSLPSCFKPLWEKPKNDDITYKHAVKYLMDRKISMSDIIRYGIGYCSDAQYANRVIVPSHDESGKLNYFIARDIFPNSKMKYKNPPMSKNVVIFELLINWKMPIVLCEGVFDAIAIRRNAIPLLGKFPSKELIKKMIQKNVKRIYIALDDDAKKDAIKLAEFLTQYGITPFLMNLQDKDPSEIGFKKFWEVAENVEPSTLSERIRGRLYG
tara:strand:+ start:137 stop:1066 length:930 start_codon:yes stop_codon:yes gene_type:complete